MGEKLELRDGSSELGPTELVTALRSEIEAAQAQFAEGKQPMFVVKGVEAEVSFVVEKSTSAGGGLHIYFVVVDAKRVCKAENVHRLKILLEPAKAGIGFAETNKG
jgi:hypothetical protein